MSSDINTNRPLLSYILTGMVDFVCLLEAGDLIKDKHVPAAIPWIIAGIVSTLIGYYWPQIRQAAARVGTCLRKKPSRLVIHWANYRAVDGGGDVYEVDEFLRQIISGDSLVVDIENHNFKIGGRNFVEHDPLPGTAKRLQVNYSFGGGQPVTTERREHGRLLLPEDSKIKWLQSEVDRLKAQKEPVSEKAWRERFLNPQWTTVTGNTFVNTTVEMDGKAFRHCKFENVTLLFHGNAPTELTVGNEFSGSKLSVDTDDPAVMMFMQLQMIINKIPGGIVEVNAKDHKGNVMSDNFSIRLGPNEQAKTQYPIPSFRLLLFATHSELQGFLGEVGDEPRFVDVDQHLNVVIPWRQKVTAAYRLRFGNMLSLLRDEILHRTGISDQEFDAAIQKAAKDAGHDVVAIRTATAKLGEIALRVNV